MEEDKVSSPINSSSGDAKEALIRKSEKSNSVEYVNMYIDEESKSTETSAAEDKKVASPPAI